MTALQTDTGDDSTADTGDDITRDDNTAENSTGGDSTADNSLAVLQSSSEWKEVGQVCLERSQTSFQRPGTDTQESEVCH